jgi:hypothetical protein
MPSSNAKMNKNACVITEKCRISGNKSVLQPHLELLSEESRRYDNVTGQMAQDLDTLLLGWEG